MLSDQVANATKRRSSRIDKAIMLAVQGVDASRKPYREEVTTGSISCHGCAYRMRHEVRPGDIVILNSGQAEFPRQARVKSIQKLNAPSGPTYNVGVELEIAGNIWRIATPPEDWFPQQSGKLLEPANHGRELRLMARTEPQRALARSEGVAPVPILTKNEADALPPWFSALMTALSKQIQVSVSEIARVTLANERKRLLDEFRAQIQNEATGTIEHVIATSKDELARRALKVLNEGAETIATGTIERLQRSLETSRTVATERFVSRLREQVAPVMEEAKADLQKLGASLKVLNEGAEAIAAGTIERLQRNLETSRTVATERFVSQLREQVAPMMEEAKADLQKLVASQTVFKEESLAIYRRVTSQLESDANARLVQTHDRLEKNSTSVVNECNEKLLELSQTVGKVARDSAQTMIASATDDAKKNLEERAAEISSNFTDQLEGSVRNYLEFIVESIAEFPKKTPAA